MESTNRTILPELTRTARAEASLKLPIHWFQAGVASTKRWLTRWRSASHVQNQRGGGMAAQSQGNPWYMAGFVLVLFAWMLRRLAVIF
jgi:hypothetical protein